MKEGGSPSKPREPHRWFRRCRRAWERWGTEGSVLHLTVPFCTVRPSAGVICCPMSRNKSLTTQTTRMKCRGKLD